MRYPAVALIVALFLALAGCESMHSKTDTTDVSTETTTETPAQTTEKPAPVAPAGPVNTYMDFDDILIPSELSPIKTERYYFENDKFKTGMVTLKGRVEVNSLTDFFQRNMVKDGWVNTTAFKSPNTVLIFEKPNKSAMIKINDGTWDTVVEILVIELKSMQSAPSASGYGKSSSNYATSSGTMHEGTLAQ